MRERRFTPSNEELGFSECSFFSDRGVSSTIPQAGGVGVRPPNGISPVASKQIVSKAATQTSSIASAGAEETDSTRGRV